MKKQLLALAVAAGTLGLSQMASADFVGDSKLTLGLRNFYFNSDPREGGNQRTEEWAQGALLNYQSGYTEGAVGFGLDAIGMVGLRLDGGNGHHTGSSMIPSESDGSAVDDWSRITGTAKARFSKTEARYGALMTKLPILISSDGRLLPQTFEGGMLTSKEIDSLTFVAGQINRAVGRASTNDTKLAVAGGTEGSDHMRFAGADWQVTKDLKLQYYFANLEDYYKQHFGGLVHVLPLGDKQSFTTDLRYYKSSDDGANGTAGYMFNNNNGYASTPGEVDNTTWSAMFTYALGNHSVMLGHQRVSEDGGFVWVNQGSLPNEGAGGSSFGLFTDRMINQFARAGERTTFGQYTYDFTGLGIPGLKASAVYLSADNIRPGNGVGGDGSEWERDLQLDYAFQSSALKGLAVSLRHGSYRSNAVNANGTEATDTDQTRVIFNYTLSLM